MKRFSREEIRARLNARLAAKEPILAAEAGVGLTAKMTQKNGIDLIFITTVAMFRMRGIDEHKAFQAYGIANEETYEQIRRMNRIITEVPAIAGITANDPRLVIDEQLALYDRAHVSGIINSPSMGPVRMEMRREFSDSDNAGVVVEKEMIKYVQEQGFFTVMDAYYEEDALDFAKQKPDMIIINMNFSVEEGVDPEEYNDYDRSPNFYFKMFNPAWLKDVDGCCKAMQDIYKKIKTISPDTYVLVSGGPFNCVDNIKKLFAETDVDGLMGATLFEEDVVWKYIGENQKAYQSIKLD